MAQKVLQESEERYRTLYEDNPSMYFTVAQMERSFPLINLAPNNLDIRLRNSLGSLLLEYFLKMTSLLSKNILTPASKKPYEVIQLGTSQAKGKMGSVYGSEKLARADKGEGRKTSSLNCL